ncbi:MAG: DUF5018 domain-containing protein [Alistipes senegalensis]|nr:DUF5018 domain-containing protein [Bacteroides cellulosilyticus]MCM1351866.1 DUF5018 domain-containing protein [Alistipes senegalensis]
MKNSIKLLASALLLALAGCHDPEELTPSVVDMGLNSVSAQFATGEYKNDAQAKFTAPVTSADQERIVIDIPYYYPENTTNLVDITQMRVSANLDDNCFLSPALGTLDLTQEHWFTLTRVDGSTRQFCITGNIKKSDKCDLEAFALPSLGLSGVIDQAKQEVSLIALNDLEPALATYQLSYHATISPDPAVEALDYNNDVKLTVTAFDGVNSKTYTVKKNVPSKTKSGIREGSQKNLFVHTDLRSQWGMSGKLNYTMGVMGDYLLVCSGDSELIYVNKLTGEKVGNVDMNGTNGGGAIASDDAGHLVLCTNATAGMDAHFYTLDDVTSTPQKVLTWKNTSGTRMGQHISVRGDITQNAIITINTWAWAGTPSWSSFVRIIVENGVWGEPEKVTISGCGLWRTGDVDVEYLTTDVTGPYFKASYSANSLDWIDGATDARVAYIGPGATESGNENLSSVSCLTFNDTPYVAIYISAHFANSNTRALLFNASSQSAFSGTFDNSAAKYYGSSNKVFWGALDSSVTASGDVLLTQSPDGYFLYLYWIGGNSNFIRAEQFDCIEQ